MMYITFSYEGCRYAVGCQDASEANVAYSTARCCFERASINFSGRIGKNVVKLSEEEFSQMADDIIYNE